MKMTNVQAKTNTKSKREELRRGPTTDSVEQIFLGLVDTSSVTWVELGLADGSGSVLKLNDSSDSSCVSMSSTTSQWEQL